MSIAVKFIDTSGKLIANAVVARQDSLLVGSVDLQGMPSTLRAKFDEYEQIVNGQVFSLLEQIENEIAAMGIKAVLDDGSEEDVTDLQIYPSDHAVSFKLRTHGTAAAMSAPADTAATALNPLSQENRI
jgi:hypothetical protein